MICRCGHRRDQHLPFVGLCTGENFPALVGASPLAGRFCACMRYQPETPRPGWITRLFRRNDR